ncbi:hypothetical protein [Candidatus Nitrosocosmicus arcticus]|uniref:Uncharacterized protein n=1 Tax=Candidatus Nitrosocosmicus arcticus TaxID=2035267 RepID=A0A557SWK6_9ARCH|nr:hypothetical protein [Candidatus Nitrosocosmicus arcticus]TVP40992.1 hypothetical protein NARC_50173 [Candidatus Nitrosocosmicus arcticus]
MSEKYCNTSSSNRMDNTSTYENGSSSNSSKNLQRQSRQVSEILFIGLVLIVALSVFLSSNVMLGAGNNNIDQLAYGVTSLPQPNDNSTLIKVRASNALFEPAAGLSNVFGPGGLFPFDNFNCADALTCGVSAGENAEFIGTFEKGNINNMTGYEATYTSPVTYGPHQIAGNEYKITLTDVNWNSPSSSLPTEQPQFAALTNNVGFDQVQHGASNVDRSDVPQLSNMAFLYGHAQVTDITNGNNTVVAEDVFTHVMVGHVMNEQTFYQDLRDEALSPNFVFLFAINIPDDTELPGVGSLTAEEAQGFTPLASDQSLDNSPPIDYPVSIPEPRDETMDEIEEPGAQSTTWPVANKEQPLLFNFLVYQDTNIKVQ